MSNPSSPMPPSSAPAGELSNPTQAGAPPADAAGADPMVGRTIGEYRIDRVLGKGGMGAVYEAVDRRTGFTVALKLLPDALSRDPIALKRFRAEAAAAGRLRHPNCVAVLDVAEAGPETGAGLIAMELIRGGNARDFLDRRGPFNWPEATRITADVCRGLAAAHASGIVHRDIKPANILRSTEGVVKLADFGLAKEFEGGHDSMTGSLTGSGTVVGTPHYMSPEQCNSLPPDPRSDVYSLGATYYALLTGRPPYAYAGNTMQIMFAHCRHAVPDPRDAKSDVPVRIAAIVGRALAKDADQRYQSALDMLADLEAVLADPASALGAAAEVGSEWNSFLNASDTLRSSTRHRPAADPQGSRRFLFIGGSVAAVALALIFYVGQTPDPVAPRPTPKPAPPTPEKAEPVPAPPERPREIVGIEPQFVVEHQAHTATMMITFVAFAPDGKSFVSTAEDRTASLRRTKDGNELFRLADEGADRQRVALFARDGSAVLCGGDDGLIRVWETGNGRLTHTWKLTGSVRGLLWMPDGKTVAACTQDGTVTFLEYPEGKPVGEPWKAGWTTRSMALSPDAKTLAAGGDDGIVRVGPLADRKPAFELKGHGKPVTALVFLDPGDRLISASEDHTAIIWNLADRTQVKVLTAHGNCVNALSVGFAGRALATASCDQSYRLWRLPEGRPLTELPFPDARQMVAVAISPDNEWMVGGGMEGILRIWRLKPVFGDASARE